MSNSAIVVMGDPRIAAVNTPQPRSDDLVDARGVAPDLAWSPLYEEPSGAFAHLRVGVIERLLDAQSHLPRDVRLLLVEGHRPARTQQHYYDSYVAELIADRGRLPADELRELASRHVSPPDVAPHVSGAAIDLMIASSDGDLLDMGTRINATPEESAGACYLDADNITSEAKRNRAALASAMRTAGFAAYPPEWWHWSFGDRYWAFSNRRTAALYGPVDDGVSSSMSAASRRRP